MEIKKLDKSEFRRENYTVYGSIASQILNNDLERIVGYSYETEYEPLENSGGVMFQSKKGLWWSHVPNHMIKHLEEISDEQSNS